MKIKLLSSWPILRRVLITLGVLLGVLVVLLVVAAILLNTESVQNRLLNHAVQALSERLQTKVEVTGVKVDVFKRQVCLKGVAIDDRQQRPMLRVGELAVSLDLHSLWVKREVVVTKASVKGVRAQICRPASPTDSALNVQFVVDAFSKPASTGTTSHGKSMTLKLSSAEVEIDTLLFATDNGRPRINAGKPNHGAFDVGHLDLELALKASVEQHGDAFDIHVHDIHGSDRGSGLVLTKASMKANLKGNKLIVNDVDVALPHTELKLPKVEMTLPTDSVHNNLTYTAKTVTGTTQLRDIAAPFAPVLRNFDMVLTLKCSITGDKNTMQFGDVHVATADKRLTINAKGRIDNLPSKEGLTVRFDVAPMTARGDVKSDILNRIAGRKLMLKQLRMLGQITYNGHFVVRWKHVDFAGKLGTEKGNLAFNFTIDDANKRIEGEVSTPDLRLGEVMDMPDIGDIACSATYNISYAPNDIRGKLPKGEVHANVTKAKYKFVSVSDMTADISSDGQVANGTIIEQKKLADVGCSFSFTDTDDMHKLNIKPKIKLHL